MCLLDKTKPACIGHTLGYPSTKPGRISHPLGYPITKPACIVHTLGYPSTKPACIGHTLGYPSTKPGYIGHTPGDPSTKPGYIGHTPGVPEHQNLLALAILRGTRAPNWYLVNTAFNYCTPRRDHRFPPYAGDLTARADSFPNDLSMI